MKVGCWRKEQYRATSKVPPQLTSPQYPSRSGNSFAQLWASSPVRCSKCPPKKQVQLVCCTSIARTASQSILYVNDSIADLSASKALDSIMSLADCYRSLPDPHSRYSDPFLMQYAFECHFLGPKPRACDVIPQAVLKMLSNTSRAMYLTSRAYHDGRAFLLISILLQYKNMQHTANLHLSRLKYLSSRC